MKPEEKEKLRQELRSLIFRNFVMKHSLSDSEVIGLLREIPELGQAQEAAMTKEETRCELRKAGDVFLEAVKERVDIHVLLCDIDGLSELVQAVKMVGHYQLVEIIQKKGFSKEFTELCDKVGRAK